MDFSRDLSGGRILLVGDSRVFARRVLVGICRGFCEQFYSFCFQKHKRFLKTKPLQTPTVHSKNFFFFDISQPRQIPTKTRLAKTLLSPTSRILPPLKSLLKSKSSSTINVVYDSGTQWVTTNPYIMIWVPTIDVLTRGFTVLSRLACGIC